MAFPSPAVLSRAAAVAGAALIALAVPRVAGAGLTWPDTPAATVARAYFDAFGRDEAAMRAFFGAHVRASDLAERPVEARLARWREMRGQLGGLEPLAVLASEPHRLSLDVRSEKAGPLQIHVELHETAPHTLRALMVEATGDGGGPGGPGGPPPPPTGPPPTDEQIVARLRADLDSLARSDRFSGVAILDRDGRTLFAATHGMASREARRAVTADTRFNIASIGKQFTAVAIRQLAQAGKLSLDDPVTRHLPDYRVTGAEKATIGMLLEHRGGIPDVFRSEVLWKDPGAVKTAGDWYALVRDMPLDFEPGTRNRYSNGGFVLLGMIVERASGMDFYEYVRRHVFEPAGMTRTASERPAPGAADVATGYTREDPEHEGAPAPPGAAPRATGPGFGRASAAGGQFATAADLVRYARALRDGRLLGSGGTRAMLGDAAGLGVAGGAPGANALLEISGPYTLVILANQDPPVAEDFAGTVGRMLAHAARAGAGPGGPRGIERKPGRP